MPPTIVYITGFRQHAGKTVTALGILSRLRRIMDPSRIAYLKPVGQELVTLSDGSQIDKDARLLQEFSGIPENSCRSRASLSIWEPSESVTNSCPTGFR